MELGAGQHSGAKNFQVAVRFFFGGGGGGNVGPDVRYVCFPGFLFEDREVFLLKGVIK